MTLTDTADPAAEAIPLPLADPSLGATEHPAQSWVVQQARSLLMDLEDAGTAARFVLHDRDASITAAVDAVFQAAGVSIVRSAVQGRGGIRSWNGGSARAAVNCWTGL